ncbi:hypothetical protein LTR85_011989 [Meristemomyces frigidus]|nr:hypothetical protein LTR85_011989 [Meristemomyces frigidus]
MLVKGHRRIIVALGCTLAFIAVAVGISGQLGATLSPYEYIPRAWAPARNASASGRNGKTAQESLHGESPKPVKNPNHVVGAPTATASALSRTHNVVYSNSTADGRYFLVDFGREYQGMNPNMVVHPTLPDTWFVVAQQYKPPEVSTAFTAELVCEATLHNGTLKCTKSPLILPIAGTLSPVCQGDIAHYNMNVGPHDARVFNGPEAPYIIYGSQSKRACFGLWMQDFRRLVEWPGIPPIIDPFVHATDLQRPPPYGVLEKNWFVFWDVEGELYLHHDVAPKRVFSKLNLDGSVSGDLAPLASAKDKVCWQKHLDAEAATYKSIHQATNSLSITMCKRHDPACKETHDNTFIMEIFQHKSFNNFHSAYEPYVMLFKQKAPFELHAISLKPIWIYGRGAAGEKRPPGHEDDADWGETEMIYVTSMSWKTAGQNYHGYLDDVMFLGFGVEDEQAGGIDVVAADVLQGLDLC